MFCPNCRAEYRPGFARCSDCGIDLVEILPPQNPGDPELNENERPDFARTRYFLAWFVPMCIYVILFFTLWIRPSLLENAYVALLLICFILVGNIRGFWMIYQAVRYERQVGNYFLLAFVPFMFDWYSFVRFTLLKQFQGSPISFAKASRPGDTP